MVRIFKYSNACSYEKERMVSRCRQARRSKFGGMQKQTSFKLDAGSGLLMMAVGEAKRLEKHISRTLI